MQLGTHLFENREHANANFKYALRFIKRGENMMSDSLAREWPKKSLNVFWKQIRDVNNLKPSLSSNSVWHKHYYDSFNCVKSNDFIVDNRR